MAAFVAVAERLPVNVVALVAIDAQGAHRRNLVARAGMTCRATELAMGAIEREARSLVMIKVPYAPVARVMAGSTVGSESAFVRIVLRVTSRAFLAGVLESGARVAGIALDRKMTARERKSGASVVEIGRLPRCLGVAALAIRSFLAGVAVVLPVAGNALRGDFLPEGHIGMADLARDGNMASTQGILRVSIMVEGGDLPVRLAVTGCAGRAEVTPVHVFLRMASIAVFRSLVHIQPAWMTCITFDFGVRLAQLEAGIPFVIELERLP